MTNVPSQVGARYLCFVVVRRSLGWGGSYGQTFRGPVWECVECGHRLPEWINGPDRQRMARHHEHGHSPCPRCGKPLLLRKDGTRREHNYRLCAGKSDGHRIEREFAKNIRDRELGRIDPESQGSGS